MNQAIENSKIINDRLNTKCSQGLQAIYICINQECLNQQPYFCSNQNCQCIKKHRQCQQLRLKIVRNKIQSQREFTSNFLKQLQDKINYVFDQMIDKLSQERDKILQKLNSGESNWLSKCDELSLQQRFEKLKNWNGCQFGKAWRQSVSKQKMNSIQSNLVTVLNHIQSNFIKLQSNELQSYLKEIKNTLFKAENPIENPKLNIIEAVQQNLLTQTQDQIYDQTKEREERRLRKSFYKGNRRPHIQFCKISEIEPGDEGLNFLAKVLSVEPLGIRGKVVLGDETGIVKAFFFLSQHIRVNEIVEVLKVEARVVKEHIEIRVPRKGKVSIVRGWNVEVDEENDISAKQWVEAYQ